MLRSIHKIVEYMSGASSVVTSSPSGGVSSFTLACVNEMISQGKLCVYYNPSGGIDRGFIKYYYPEVYRLAVWLECPLKDFIEWYQSSPFVDYDCLVVDPGDILLVTSKKITKAMCMFKPKKHTLIATAQIRLDPKHGWAPYSTLDELRCFDKSIWLINVTESSVYTKKKYVDIYDNYRSKESFLERLVVKYSPNGGIIN